MAVTTGIRGAKELQKLLKALPQRVAKRVTVNGLRAGGRVIANGMKQRVPVRTGDLRDSIIVSSAAKATRGKSNVVVGFRTPTSRRAHLVEFGTEHSAAEPFMRPALDEDGAAAIRAIGESMGKGVEREARKLASGKTSFRGGARRR